MTEAIVVADDLTGAAEIAALGMQVGWSTALVRSGLETFPPAALVVIDTDSRLDPSAQAADKVRRAVPPQAAEAAPRRWFKKVDSVLRGAIRAECTALLGVLPFDRVLLAPANPGMGRCIHAGRYRVGTTPLHQTGFARDPHHPAWTDDVCALLEERSNGLPVRYVRPTESIEPGVLAVAEVADAEQLRTWASHLHRSVLPAGGGEFFQAVLETWGEAPKHPSPPPRKRPTVPKSNYVVLGSIAPESEEWRELAGKQGAVLCPLPESLLGPDASEGIDAYIEEVAAAAAAAHTVVTWAPRQTAGRHDLPRLVSRLLAEITAALHRRACFDHLVIAGGSTAGHIFETIGWNAFAVENAWTQGVVSLRAHRQPETLITLKPGSYPWPETLNQVLLSHD